MPLRTGSAIITPRDAPISHPAARTGRAALQAVRASPKDYRGLESRIGAPTLVVWGEGDRMLPPAEAVRIAAKIAGARLVILPDAGHLPQRERPDAFAAAVADFVGSLRDGSVSSRSGPPRAP